jgi:putative redox protein
MNSNLRHAVIQWTGGMTFSGGAPDGPTIPLDGDAVAGPSPVVALLLAAASCTGSDIVSILEKSRAGLTALRIEVTGTRREDHPRRFVAIHMTFRMSGTALDQAKARRAIDLSLEKYCSVVHSLASDLIEAITYEMVLD